MAKKKKAARKMTEATEDKATSQARLELPAEQMEEVRVAARSIGLSLSAFIRMSVLNATAEVKKRMGL